MTMTINTTTNHEEQERQLDEMLADSFPASDPPSSWAGPSRAAIERIVLHPYPTTIEARVANGRLDPSIPKRDRLLFEAPATDAAASVATAAGTRAALIGGAVSAAVLLAAGVLHAIADTIATTPLGGHATAIAMVSVPFAVALARFAHTYSRWTGRPVEIIGALPRRRQPVFLAVRETRSSGRRDGDARTT